jgi:hypothetical protein
MCEHCDNCEYICEGVYYCDMIQECVIDEFFQPTENYRGCHGKYFMEKD